MNTSKFRTARNRLTRYAHACGYVEHRSTGNRHGDNAVWTEMYMEHGVFHVRQFDRRSIAPVFRTFWESFENLIDARKLFDAQPGIIVSN